MLELRAVSKSYGSVLAVDRLDLTVPDGSRTAIVGASGSGKTTLLRLIAGFEAPDGGSIALNGIILADGSKMIPAHKRLIGYLPQDGALFPHLTVTANIGFGLPDDLPGRSKKISELAEMVALDPAMLKRWPHELSGGQQQRVALARALAQNPRLMLLDEPFSALDTGLRAATRKAVAKLLGDAGVTTVLVTHDQAEALSFADQIAVMRSGRLVQVGQPIDLYLRPRDEATALFLGDAIILPARLENGWAHCKLGRIAVDDAGQSGMARIMLRPEQVQLGDATTAATAPQGCLGTVTEVDFTGHACMLTVQIADNPIALMGGEAAGTLLVRSPVIQAPQVGAQVRVTVVGPAHVLALG